MSTSFPLIVEQRLEAPTRRLLRGDFRDVRTLPKLAPGTVLVLQVDGTYHVHRDLTHLTGHEPEVVGAVAASVVDLRTRPVSVQLTLPSLNPSASFDVRVIFNCRVTNPEEVAQAGTQIWGIEQALSHHLLSDGKLFAITQNESVELISTLRPAIHARIQAYCSVRPPRLRGMSVMLSNVTVVADVRLVDHDAALVAERRKQERSALVDEGEDRRVERLAGMDATRMQALGVARGEISIGRASDRLYDEKARARQELLQYVENLAATGSMDLIEPHAQQLVNKLTEALTDTPVADASRLEGSRPAARGLPSRPSDDELPEPMEGNDDDEY